jgi:hypothetical protein
MAVHKSSYAICIFLATAFAVEGQQLITGMVADSAMMQPIMNVNVKVRNGPQITVTDFRGLFSIQANDFDTLIFSRVGYFTKQKQARIIKDVVVVFLTEQTNLLKTITIDAEHTVPWLPKLKPASPYRNSTYDQRTLNTPGFQGFQTFGPGIIIGGPFSRFSKSVKEKKKLHIVQEENYKARNYVDIVNDTTVKNKIIRENHITEDEYFKLLAIFNEKNKDIIYELESNELISILILFYSENAKKK